MRRFSRSLVVGATAAWFCVGSHALAKTCDLEIEGNDQMQYNKKELVAAGDCTEIKVTVKHVGKLPKAAMGHNWVLTEEKNQKSVADAGMKAGPAADYAPKGDKNVIAMSKLLGPGESDVVTFKTAGLKKGGNYVFFCTFPGHMAMMNGKFLYK